MYKVYLLEESVEAEATAQLLLLASYTPQN